MSAEKETVHFQGQEGLQTLDFSAKEKVKKQSVITPDGGVKVIFAFRTGVVRTFTMPGSHELFARAAMHGLDQKFGDEFAGLADPDDCVEAFDAMAARLAEGQWNQERASDGLAGVSVLAKALVRLSGKTIETVKETLKALSAGEKAALRKAPKVAQVIAEIEAEREAKRPSDKKVDTEAILAALGG